MKNEKITKEEIIDIMNEIVFLAEKRNFPLNSMNIEFKNIEHLVTNKKLDKSDKYIIEEKFDCSLCGGDGMLGICCRF